MRVLHPAMLELDLLVALDLFLPLRRRDPQRDHHQHYQEDHQQQHITPLPISLACYQGRRPAMPEFPVHAQPAHPAGSGVKGCVLSFRMSSICTLLFPIFTTR
jgi:hypothetical protein